MTNSNLNPSDLFLVSKDLDGDGKKYESFSVPYSEVIQDIQGEKGETGATGPTGQIGPAGADGQNLEVQGLVDYYDELIDIRKTLGPGDAGMVYIVKNDYSQGLTSYTGPFPGTTECKDLSAPTDATCERNVLYVFSYYTVPYFGQSNSDAPADFKFLRMGPLTGPVGATGYTADTFDDIMLGTDDATKYTIRLRDQGRYTETPTADDPNGSNPGKYIDTDLNSRFSGGLKPSIETGDIRGATGPYYDEIVPYGKLILKDNPDFDDTMDDTLDTVEAAANPDLVYDATSLDDYKAKQGKAVDIEYPGNIGIYNPSKKYYNDYRLQWTSTPGTGGSDPHSLLDQFQTMDIVGATGSSTGSPGPQGIQGEKGDKGDKGDSPTPEEIVDLIENITPPGDDGDKGAFVHRYGVDIEKVYGVKHVVDSLKFDPAYRNSGLSGGLHTSGTYDPIMKFPDDLNVFTSQISSNRYVSIVKGSNYASDDALHVQVKTSGNAGKLQLGLDVKPNAGVFECKGPIISNRIDMRDSAYAGLPYSAMPGRVRIGPVKFEMSQGYEFRNPNHTTLHTGRSIKINSSSFMVDGRMSLNPNSTVTRGLTRTIVATANGDLGFSNKISDIFPDESSSEFVVGDLLDKTSSLNIVNNLKPRLYTDQGTTKVGLLRTEIAENARAKVMTHDENNQINSSSELSDSSMFSLLISAIQKLSDRIDALESN